jgi:hypothetical protein
MLVVGSILAAAYAFSASAVGVRPSHALAFGWPIAFLFLVALWLVEDSKSFPVIYKPFEFGFLVYLAAPFYLPYYLWRTRRFGGLLLLVGFVVLYYLGSLAQLLLAAES